MVALKLYGMPEQKNLAFSYRCTIFKQMLGFCGIIVVEIAWNIDGTPFGNYYLCNDLLNKTCVDSV